MFYTLTCRIGFPYIIGRRMGSQIVSNQFLFLERMGQSHRDTFHHGVCSSLQAMPYTAPSISVCTQLH